MSALDDALTRLGALDSTGQLDDVNGLPDQLTDALWRCETAKLDAADAPGGLMVCGMGGSAIGGDLAAAAFGDRLERQLSTVRGYGLPPWAGDDVLIMCCSYSGNTEETLQCYDEAGALGAPRIVATTGGALGERARKDGVPVIPFPGILQPRAAVAYTFTSAAAAATLAGAGPSLRSEIETAAAELAAARDYLNARALEIAEALDGTIPVIYGADLTVPVAYRWKTQINEYAKLPSFSHSLPEADHNEIVGWEGVGGRPGPHAAVFLLDSEQHERNRRRAELTSDAIAFREHLTLSIETEGSTRTSRLFWAVMLGDLVSLHLAATHGVDPAPVVVIEELKDALGRP